MKNRIGLIKSIFNKRKIENRAMINIDFIGKSVLEILNQISRKERIIKAAEQIGAVNLRNYNPLLENSFNNTSFQITEKFYTAFSKKNGKNTDQPKQDQE